MLKIDAKDAYDGLLKAKSKSYRFPNKGDPRYRDGGLYPDVHGKFALRPGERIFTMGSCFAREIEEHLVERGFDVPVARFQVPAGEVPTPGNHLINEYNFGTMSQRVRSVLGTFQYAPEAGVEHTPEGAIDLFLHIAAAPVSEERLHARRAEIDALYRQLHVCPTVIITLGLVESWYDEEHQCYINRAPSYRWVKKHPNRFSFRRLDLPDLLGLANEFIMPLAAAGRRVLLTVSPIPLETSFQPSDIVVSNQYGKSMLRVVAEECRRTWPTVDYFPSFEIATSYGYGAYKADNVHLDRGIVANITSHMIENYVAV